jgi:nucleoside-diphosphate-sugar epimerase
MAGRGGEPGAADGELGCARLACRAAARGQPYSIPFTGPLDLIHADDVARFFLLAIEAPPQGARAINLIGRRTDTLKIAEAIARLVPGARISTDGPPLPVEFPHTEPALTELFPDWSPMTLEEGLITTIDHYRGG